MTHCSRLRGHMLCCGGHNIDMALPHDNKTKKFNELLRRYDLVKIIKSCTHLNLATNRASKLDLLITNDKLMYSQHGIVPTGVSDHSLILQQGRNLNVTLVKYR